MRRSTDRILTTHVGALPAPLDVWARPDVADDRLGEAVAEVVAMQRDIGVDFINEGELTKGGHWVEYLPTRLGGYEPAEGGAYTQLLLSSKDWIDFNEFYMAVLQKGTLFEMSGARNSRSSPKFAANGFAVPASTAACSPAKSTLRVVLVSLSTRRTTTRS